MTLSLTAVERDDAVRRAAAVGLRLAPYLRECALAGSKDGSPTALPLAFGATQIARLAVLRQAVAEVRKAGVNVNQIARAANAALLAGQSVGAVLEGSGDALAALRASLAELLRWPGVIPSGAKLDDRDSA